MNADKPNSPKYYRLLEIGETIQEGDYAIGNYKIGSEISNLSGQLNKRKDILRPVQVDEWIEYSVRKPTKEDGATSLDRGQLGNIEYLDGDYHLHWSNWDSPPSNTFYWRRITPPQPTKPKSVKLEFTNRVTSQDITPNPDGTAKLSCGDTLAAKSIEEFIAARNEVMK